MSRRRTAEGEEKKPKHPSKVGTVLAEEPMANPVRNKLRRGGALGPGLSVFLGKNRTACMACVHFGIHYTYDMAEAMGMHPPTVHRNLKRLVNAGLLCIKEDRRITDRESKIQRYEFTPVGKKIRNILVKRDRLFKECMQWLEQRYPK